MVMPAGGGGQRKQEKKDRVARGRETLTLEEDLGEGMNPAGILEGEREAGEHSRQRSCKGPEAASCLVMFKDQQEGQVAGAE